MAALCGNFPKFRAKYRKQIPTRIDRNHQAISRVKTAVVTVPASGKWAQKQPPFKGYCEQKLPKMRDKMIVW